MISSSAWVPRGFASEFPEQYELNDEEMDRINEMAKLKLTDAQEGLANARKEEGQDDGFEDVDEDAEDIEVDTKTSEPKSTGLKNQIEIDDDLAAYDLENYDDEADSDGEEVTMFPGLSKDVKFHQNEDGSDPYLTLPLELDNQEEKKELQIYPSDNLVLATRTEDDISYLDIYVYDDGAGAPEGSPEEEEDKLDPDVAKGLVRESNLYVHHDIMLPAFPLCVEWVNFRVGGDNSGSNIGNYAAIGTFDPQIEIWNLDCIDKAFPDMILGEPDNNLMAGLSRKKKKKNSTHVTTHHTDAVLSLSHNRTHRSVLASTSADHTVKLWDLAQGVAARSLQEIHNNKTVSSSQWHHTESSILLTGGYDGTVGVSDVRIEDLANMTKSYKVTRGEEVENVSWAGACAPESFYAGTDNGNIYCFDIRNDSKPIWTLHAHDAGISSLNVNAHVPGMFITSAMGEKTVKMWKAGSNSPSMVLSRDFGVGNVLTTAFAGDVEVAGNLTVGGVSGALKLWDSFSNSAVRNTFRSELKDLQTRAKEDAKSNGRASRLARKYQGSHGENIISVEAGGFNDESDEE